MDHLLEGIDYLLRGSQAFGRERHVLARFNPIRCILRGLKAIGAGVVCARIMLHRVGRDVAHSFIALLPARRRAPTQARGWRLLGFPGCGQRAKDCRYLGAYLVDLPALLGFFHNHVLLD